MTQYKSLIALGLGHDESHDTLRITISNMHEVIDLWVYLSGYGAPYSYLATPPLQKCSL